MSYSAIVKMRAFNQERFGMDVGPFAPGPIGDEATGMDLKSAMEMRKNAPAAGSFKDVGFGKARGDLDWVDKSKKFDK